MVISIWRDMNSYQHHPTSILILLDYGFGARFKVWSSWNQFGEAATTAKCLPFRGTFSPLPHFQGTLWCMPHNIAKTCADELYPRLKLLGNAYWSRFLNNSSHYLNYLKHVVSLHSALPHKETYTHQARYVLKVLHPKDTDSCIVDHWIAFQVRLLSKYIPRSCFTIHKSKTTVIETELWLYYP